MEREKRKILIREHMMIFNIVKGVIHEWDPYALLAGGAPTDEFDGEIRSIALQAKSIKSSDDASQIIRKVFSDSFSEDDFKKDVCEDVGMKLYSSLRKYNALK